MNPKIYRQGDSRWGSLPYPTKAYSFAGNGCGCCACTHNIIEIPKYANYTPANVRPYMVEQGFATKGHGTTWAGITKTLEHYGFKVSNPNIGNSMTKAWELLNQSNAPKQGVLLFRGGVRGGVRWTSGGHYVAFLNYKMSGGKHYFYTKDSGGRHHDGWYCYETTMKGLLPQIWIVTAKPKTSTAPAPKKTTSTATKPKAASKKVYTGKLPTITLRQSSKGDSVVLWQKFLNWYGNYGLKTDGMFGTLTKEATKKFQKAHGLTQDGVAGPNTYAKAKTYLSVVTKTTGTATKTAAKTTTVTKSTTTTTKTTSTLPKKCIDVSYWQGKISVENWKKIKKTCGYAICRASYTGQSKFALNKDSTFSTNFKNAKAAGLKVGAYHYSQAITVDEAKKEAKYLCDILKDYKVDFYVVCDFEYGGRLNSKIGKKASDIANAFCDVVKAHGYSPCIYANTSTLNSNLTNPKYPVWVAQYSSSCTYKGSKVMWQYTSTGKVDGISAKNTNNGSANVDLSIVYNEPAIKPIPKTATTSTKATTSTPTKTTASTVVKKKVAYSGTFPTLNNNRKIINGMAYHHCYPYGTPLKEYSYKKGKPKIAYTNGINKAFPKHNSWPNKKQSKGACCDILVGELLSNVNIKVPKDLADQLIKMPKMTKELKSVGYYNAKDFRGGYVVQRGRKDKSGHTFVICELINGKRYIANAHYKKHNGTYAVMDSVVETQTPKKWKYYKCYIPQGAIRTWYGKGDYGYDVLYIQKFLNWYNIPCTIDGEFGVKTEAAVKVFQEMMGLVVSGRVGEKTIEMMKKARK